MLNSRSSAKKDIHYIFCFEDLFLNEGASLDTFATSKVEWLREFIKSAAANNEQVCLLCNRVNAQAVEDRIGECPGTLRYCGRDEASYESLLHHYTQLPHVQEAKLVYVRAVPQQIVGNLLFSGALLMPGSIESDMNIELVNVSEITSIERVMTAKAQSMRASAPLSALAEEKEELAFIG